MGSYKNNVSALGEGLEDFVTTLLRIKNRDDVWGGSIFVHNCVTSFMDDPNYQLSLRHDCNNRKLLNVITFVQSIFNPINQMITLNDELDPVKQYLKFDLKTS